MKRKLLVLAILMMMLMTLFSSTVMAADEKVTSVDAPQNLIVGLQKYEDGTPYFELKWKVPASVEELYAKTVEWEDSIFVLFEMKIGNGSWVEYTTGSAFEDGPSKDLNPVDAGIDGAIDIQANTYSFRVRYRYLEYEDGYPTNNEVYSAFSNTASIGVPPYSKASQWAEPELNKAEDNGLIPEILRNADMTQPITREEFAELAVLLCEKAMNVTAEAASPNPFTDTVNPQILKAFKLGITTGTSATTFAPKMLVNREQCATMLFRAIKAIKPDGDYSIAGVKDFPDQKNISNWAYDATKYMSKIGVIKGNSAGEFMPKATTTAQEASGFGMATREAAILMAVRTYEKLGN